MALSNLQTQTNAFEFIELRRRVKLP
ncbi:uncharacterized protein FRV6_08008 [Fusarium oxysporum]|uniref:Uncharacterized protein n=1 Tax=Fusarium oxysporum TaxID=5507 RepID=A0A2H3TDQ6_FUSOX|nr:uncharacterized protein FRV6_08008 [Fusarium oxysporum]